MPEVRLLDRHARERRTRTAVGHQREHMHDRLRRQLGRRDGRAVALPGMRVAHGRPLLKHRHLRQLGYALVVVPYWEWGQVSGDEAAEVDYLWGKLDSVVVGEPAV